VDVPEEELVGELDVPEVDPVGDVEEPEFVPEVEPVDFATVTFGAGGATGLPELKSESKITAIPADFETLSESLIA
jgi:hypothetical protein